MDRIVYEIEVERTASGWEARCPELEVTAFGDSQDDARTALRRRVSDYLEDCEEMGDLEEVLIEAGAGDGASIPDGALSVPRDETLATAIWFPPGWSYSEDFLTNLADLRVFFAV